MLAQNASNPIQVALLRWYQANSVTQFTGDGGCTAPTGMAFDGVHVWIACNTANRLEELNASDGKWLATVTGITTPANLVYDGQNIWATNGSTTSGTVYKVNVAEVNAGCSSGPLCVTSFTGVGSGPWGMTFDGTSVWVASFGSSNVLYKIPQSGSPTPVTVSSCAGPTTLAFDTQYIWVTCGGNSTLQLQQLNKSDGSLVHAISLTHTPFALAYDGAGITCPSHPTNSPGNLWVTSDSADNTVWEISACTYAVSSPIAIASPDAIAFDSKYIWVANYSSGQVTKLLASSPLTTIPGSPFPAGAHPASVVFDGGNIWVANQASNSVSKF